MLKMSIDYLVTEICDLTFDNFSPNYDYEKKVILVEKDPVIAGVWEYLIAATREDILGLPLLSPTDDLREMNLAPAERHLIGYWVGGAQKRPGWGLYKWAQQRPAVVYFWGEKCRQRIANSVEHISHWEIICDDFTVAPDIEASWFIDPPYTAGGHCYRCSSKDIDYQALAAWCRSRKGQVQVCEQLGADWLPFSPFCTQSGANKNRRIQEVIWPTTP